MDPQAIISAVASDLKLELGRVSSAVQLFDEGNTIPFVARYRKELTGTLDEDQLRQIAERLHYRRNMEDRRGTILHSMDEQGVLTPELKQEIKSADTLQHLEDLYRPYRPKRRTRAMVARERGLQKLADLVRQQVLEGTRDQMAQAYLAEEVPTVDAAYAGARDIVAEEIADDPYARSAMRKLILRHGALNIELADESQDTQGIYQMYYNFYGDFRGLKPHQILALNRGEREGVLKINVEVPEPEALGIIAHNFPVDTGSPLAEDLIEARKDSYQRLLFPSVAREMRRQITERADEHAIEVFSTNLRALLLQAPMRGQTVLGIDPGYRTGCKIAVVDPTGRVLATRAIYPDRHKEQAEATLQHLVHKHKVTVIAIGNGTASRETETLVAGMIGEGLPVKYTIVSEAGASVYSASPLARQELPNLDVSLRGAVSIARRLQDPLAELVKIDPKAIGVGLYQHDVNQKALSEALDAVVESTVNSVGADLNTASPALLQYISGVGPKTAEAIVAHRDTYGAFATREALVDVPGVGPKTFQQAAGFVRILEGDTLLDNTPIHPESYPAAQALLALIGLPLGHPTLSQELDRLQKEMNLKQLAADLHIGRPTLEDILEALARPGRDPRDDLEGPMLRSDVLSIEDLHAGMHLKGTVRNVVDFGAFVDIGVKRNGLIHISRMGAGYVRNPHDKVSPGDVVEVEVIDVDLKRGRISLELVE